MQKFSGAVLIAVVILITTLVVHAQPQPHGIQGIVYLSDAETEAPWGTNFSVNDTTSGDFIEGTTGAGPHSGWYSVSLNGADGDIVVLKAWNATHNGERTVILTGGDMTDITVCLTNLSTEQQHTPTPTASRSGTGSAGGATEATQTTTPALATSTPAATPVLTLTPAPITPEATRILTPAATAAPTTPLSTPTPDSKKNVPGFEIYFALIAFFVLIVAGLLKKVR
ncbi:hypothetical protein C5S35_00025 [Candidatus Methanophagaceae archaeon]|nr:hypothetical protein C5S35_00025 [Methanophagales archaeon]